MALAGLLVPVQLPPDRLLSAWWSAAHVPLFFLVSLLFLSGLKGRHRIAMALFFVVAVPLLEWGQVLTGRNLSVTDMALGWAGVGAAWWVTGRRWPVVGWLVLVLATVMLPGTVVYDRYEARRAFPVLDDFSSPFYAGRWWINGAETERFRWADGDGWGLRFRTAGEGDLPYPGMFMADFEQDWSGKQALWLKLWWMPEEEAERERPGPRLIIQIEDYLQAPYADRFQTEFRLAAGWNEWRVPLEGLQTMSGREMNLDDIATWGFYLVRAELREEIEVIVDRVWLEP